MKRYSSGLYARLGFSVAIHSNPDIVLVDEVLSVGDASFRRRALEALRGLIASGKTVLFISHDMWNVRRLCSDILWMEERQRARLRRGRRDRRALHERGQPAGAGRTRRRRCRAIAAAPAKSASSRSSLLDADGRAGGDCSRRTTRWWCAGRIVAIEGGRAAGLPGRDRRRRHRRGGDDGEHGDRHGTAARPTAVEGPGEIEIRFAHLPLRPRQYVLRLSITDAVPAGVVRRRHRGTALRGHRPGRRRRQPGRRAGRPGDRCRSRSITGRPIEHRLAPMNVSRDPFSFRCRTARAPATCCARAGCSIASSNRDPSLQRRAAVADVEDAAFVREFERPTRAFVDQPAHMPRGLEARLLAIVQASYLSRGQTESVRIRLAEARANGIIRWLCRSRALIGRVLVEPFTRNGSRYALSDRLVSHPADGEAVRRLPAGAGDRRQSRAGVLRSAAAAHRAAARRASAWRSIRAGTTSPTS